MRRWRVACDACDRGGWIGPRASDASLDAWCEGCQTGHVLAGPGPAPACPGCGGVLTLAEPRFEELPGETQQIAAVLAAWCGDPEPLGRLLPGCPRFLAGLDDPEPRAGNAAAAGDQPQARWDRAARLVIEAVAAGPGLADAALLARAREAAGEPSPYRGDPTVGRLLWTLLVDRARASATAGLPPVADAPALRAAEREFEFDTFWDRGLVLHGYAELGMKRRAGQVAAAVASRQLAQLGAEPFARGPAGAWLRAMLAAAGVAVRERRPGDAMAILRSVLERDDVRRYRVPCLACGRGSVGLEPPPDGNERP